MCSIFRLQHLLSCINIPYLEAISQWSTVGHLAGYKAVGFTELGTRSNYTLPDHIFLAYFQIIFWASYMFLDLHLLSRINRIHCRCCGASPSAKAIATLMFQEIWKVPFAHAARYRRVLLSRQQWPCKRVNGISWEKGFFFKSTLNIIRDFPMDIIGWRLPDHRLVK